MSVYNVAWPAAPLGSSAEAAGTWLVLGAGGGVGAALAARLAARGAQVERATPPGDGESAAWAATWRARGASLRGVVFVGACAADRETDGDVLTRSADDAALDDAVSAALAGDAEMAQVRARRGETRGAVAALAVAQALAQLGGRALPRLWFVTRGAQAVVAGDAPSPSGAAVWGLGRVVAREYPRLRCSALDLPGSGDALESALEAACAELLADGTDDQIALRADGRHLPQMAPLALAPATAPLRGDGTYVITGGLGALGLATAGWLVTHGAQHLVLLGRRGVPDAAAAAALAELRERGATVHVAALDAADAAAVRGALADAGGPPVRGIVHAAGVLDDAIVLRQSAAHVRRAAAPKLDAALALVAATRGAPLDFLALYSSVSAAFGQPGQANYAAANAALDALAHRLRGANVPAVSIAWGPWGEIGMATRESAPRRQHGPLAPLVPAQAFRTLEQLLHVGVPPHVLVMRFVGEEPT